MDFLSRIQSKSKETKKHYAILSAGMVTGMIAIVWFSTLPARFAEIKTEEIATTESTEPSFNEVLDDTKSQLGNIIEWNTDAVQDIQDELNENPMPDPSPEKKVEAEPSLDGAVTATNPNIIMPQNVSPKTVSKQPQVILIETKKTNAQLEPKKILIGTSTKKSE